MAAVEFRFKVPGIGFLVGIGTDAALKLPMPSSFLDGLSNIGR